MDSSMGFFEALAAYIGIVWSFIGGVSFFGVGDLSFRDVIVGFIIIYLFIALFVRIFGGSSHE